jgi:hypothetical protein
VEGDVEAVGFVNVATPVTAKVDLRVVAPVTPNPAATSKVEPIIVAPEMLPVPTTTKLELRVAAPVTDKVDLRVVAPVTPSPAPTSKVEPIIVAPDTLRVDLRMVDPVTPNPAATSKVEPIIVAPEILPVPVNIALPVKVFAPAIVCAAVVIMPEAPEPATGILNVCVEPEDTILKSVPEYPVANDWLPVTKPFNEVIPPPVVEIVIAFGELETAIPDPA